MAILYAPILQQAGFGNATGGGSETLDWYDKTTGVIFCGVRITNCNEIIPCFN